MRAGGISRRGAQGLSVGLLGFLLGPDANRPRRRPSHSHAPSCEALISAHHRLALTLPGAERGKARPVYPFSLLYQPDRLKKLVSVLCRW